ncbi:hypothetical protein JCM4914_01380 [Streptomyces platensis subsp. malvinus]
MVFRTPYRRADTSSPSSRITSSTRPVRSRTRAAERAAWALTASAIYTSNDRVPLRGFAMLLK